MHSRVFGLQYLKDYCEDEVPSVRSDSFDYDSLPNGVDYVDESNDLASDIKWLSESLSDYMDIRLVNGLWVMRVASDGRDKLLDSIFVKLKGIMEGVKDSMTLYNLRRAVKDDAGFLFYVDNYAQCVSEFIDSHSGMEFVVDSSADIHF